MESLDRRQDKRIALVVACTKRKHGAVQLQMQFHTLGRMKVEKLAKEWIGRMNSTKGHTTVEELYCGEGWKHSLGAYVIAKEQFERASLYILSAGFGLLRSDDLVPPYSATFAPDRDQVAKQIDGIDCVSEAHREWWHAINVARDNSIPHTLAELSSFDYVFVAASVDYIKAMINDLTSLATKLGPERLYIIGTGVSQTYIEVAVRHCMLPVDISIETMLPGPRSNVNQRALEWVVGTILPRISWDLRLIKVEIAKELTVCRSVKESLPKRELHKMDDNAIMKWINLKLLQDPSISKNRLLREFRQGRSCEQKRFSQLVDIVRQETHGAVT